MLSELCAHIFNSSKDSIHHPISHTYPNRARWIFHKFFPRNFASLQPFSSSYLSNLTIFQHANEHKTKLEMKRLKVFWMNFDSWNVWKYLNWLSHMTSFSSRLGSWLSYVAPCDSDKNSFFTSSASSFRVYERADSTENLKNLKINNSKYDLTDADSLTTLTILFNAVQFIAPSCACSNADFFFYLMFSFHF